MGLIVEICCKYVPAVFVPARRGGGRAGQRFRERLKQGTQMVLRDLSNPPASFQWPVSTRSLGKGNEKSQGGTPSSKDAELWDLGRLQRDSNSPCT